MRALPAALLIGSAIFIALTIVPMSLEKVSILSPEIPYETYSKIVKSKAYSMKWSFAFLILALVFISIIMISLGVFRDVLLQAVST